jgi:acetyltransferase-like isoleucine patch superfamily enzyme
MMRHTLHVLSVILINKLTKLFSLIKYRIIGPPRILTHSQDLNAEILRLFGANIGKNNVRILSPITIHNAFSNLYEAYRNLTVNDDCVLNGNIYLDLTSKITLKKGVSLGPGVIIMSHNPYNRNSLLEDRLQHTCGVKSVLIKEGAGIKANALVTMG